MTEPEFRGAFLANEQQERIKTGRVACALVVFLMPVGVVLDCFVYSTQITFFLILRLVCSALVGLLWFLHTTTFGRRHYRLLGLPIALLPALFITWMIYAGKSPTGAYDGPASPYYAGLNLILLAVSVVVHWSVRESLLAFLSVLLMYSLACLPRVTA